MKRPKLNGTVIISIIIISLAFIFVALWTTNVNIKFTTDCRVENIDYVDLEHNATCWSDKFSTHYCPLPQTIDCNIDLDVPFNLKIILQMLGEVY